MHKEYIFLLFQKKPLFQEAYLVLAEKNMAKYKATLDALPNEQLKKMAQLVAEKKERSEKLQVCRKLI